MTEKTAISVLAVTAKIVVKHPSGVSSVTCTTSKGLADEALNCLVQDLGTADAWAFINKKMETFRADYAGIAGTAQ